MEFSLYIYIYIYKLKLFLCLTINLYAMKTWGGENLLSPVFLISALVENEWSASRLCMCFPGEGAPGTHWVGGCVDARAGPDDKEK
jgi:hypothetical protein